MTSTRTYNPNGHRASIRMGILAKCELPDRKDKRFCTSIADFVVACKANIFEEHSFNHRVTL